MALYEVKDPFIVPEPKIGKYIDQQYVWDCLPINKYQRKALFDLLVRNKEIDYDALTPLAERPLIEPKVLEDFTSLMGAATLQQDPPSPTDSLHPNTNSPSLDGPNQDLNHETECEQTLQSKEPTF